MGNVKGLTMNTTTNVVATPTPNAQPNQQKTAPIKDLGMFNHGNVETKTSKSPEQKTQDFLKDAASVANKKANPEASHDKIDPWKTNNTEEGEESETPQVRKFKVKVDGEEREVDEDTLKKGWSHQEAANKRMQEALKKTRDAEIAEAKFKKLMESFDTEEGVFAYLESKGVDVTKAMEKKLYQHYQNEMKDPREREIDQYKRENERLLKEREDQENAKRQAFLDERTNELAREYNEQFKEVIQEHGYQDPEFVAQIARKIKDFAERYEERITPKEAAFLMEKDLQRTMSHLTGKMSGEKLAHFLGEAGLAKIREYDTGRLKTPVQQVSTPKQPEHLREIKQKDNVSFEEKQAMWRKSRGF